MIKLGKDKTTPLILVVVYLLIIVYITLLSRSSSLLRLCKLEPFWSYIEWYRGSAVWNSQILFNIALFVPLGYFLIDVLQNWSLKRAEIISLLLSGFLSVSIETVQYFEGLGTCDLDDLVHNLLGACLGIIIYILFVHYCSKEWLKRCKLCLSLLFLIAGAAGCNMAYSAGKSVNYKAVDQFDFDIKHVVSDGRTISLQGNCNAYYRETPLYQIYLKGEETGKVYKSDTVFKSSSFNAVVSVETAEKFEADVKFKGYNPMNSFTYVNNDKVEYVSGKVIVPETDGTDLNSIVEKGVLKAFVPEYEVYVYQCNDVLYWLIGTPVDKRTEIIFHLHTNEPEKLPDLRRKYKFANLGFRSGAKNEITKKMRCGKYRVFERTLPSEYNITSVTVGFNTSGTITWTRSFRLKK